jgi:hypothetical protein
MALEFILSDCAGTDRTKIGSVRVAGVEIKAAALDG